MEELVSELNLNGFVQEYLASGRFVWNRRESPYGSEEANSSRHSGSQGRSDH